MQESLTFADLAHIEEVQPKTEGDTALFSELAFVLKKYGALNRFGITLLHKHFRVGPDEILLETTDQKTREQKIQPVLAISMEGLDMIETSWRLRAGGQILTGCFCARDPRDGVHTGQHLPSN